MNLHKDFQVGQVWRTREGGTARVDEVNPDSGLHSPVAVSVTSAPWAEHVDRCGNYVGNETEHELDLVELTAEQCPTCKGAGGYVTAEWVDPETGPESEGQRCEECDGTGSIPITRGPLAKAFAVVTAGPQAAPVPSWPSIPLTPAEIQSGSTRVHWAEGLIRQLPADHDGRNSWLLNYADPSKPSTAVPMSSIFSEAQVLRAARCLSDRMAVEAGADPDSFWQAGHEHAIRDATAMLLATHCDASTETAKVTSPAIPLSEFDARPRAYIAGPMTGLPELNFPAFHAKAAEYRAKGYFVMNPAEINPDPTAAWASCMRADIPAMLSCDTVVLLPGFSHSRGATLELHIAEALGLTIVYPPEVQP